MYNMNSYIRMIAFLSTLIHVNSKNEPVGGEYEPAIEKPEKCYGTDAVLERQCCIFPPFFNRVTARECGGRVVISYFHKHSNITAFRRGALKPCDHWKCILGKYKILYTIDDEERVSTEKYFDHLDKWVKLNPSFKSIITNAILHCKQRYALFLPFSPCEFSTFNLCIRDYVNVDCPELIPTPGCREQKEFYDECREFFM